MDSIFDEEIKNPHYLLARSIADKVWDSIKDNDIETMDCETEKCFNLWFAVIKLKIQDLVDCDRRDWKKNRVKAWTYFQNDFTEEWSLIGLDWNYVLRLLNTSNLLKETASDQLAMFCPNEAYIENIINSPQNSFNF